MRNRISGRVPLPDRGQSSCLMMWSLFFTAFFLRLVSSRLVSLFLPLRSSFVYFSLSRDTLERGGSDAFDLLASFILARLFFIFAITSCAQKHRHTYTDFTLQPSQESQRRRRTNERTNEKEKTIFQCLFDQSNQNCSDSTLLLASRVHKKFF